MRRPFAHSTPLHIGQVIASCEPQVVRTVLGSCVAVCMHHPVSKASAICHAIYASSGPPGDTRYVRGCVLAMDRFIRSVGIAPATVEVKLFGGASAIHNGGKELSMFTNHNVESAIRCLEDLGYKLHSVETGGSLSRELYFDFATGHVYVRKFGTPNTQEPVRKGLEML